MRTIVRNFAAKHVSMDINQNKKMEIEITKKEMLERFKLYGEIYLLLAPVCEYNDMDDFRIEGGGASFLQAACLKNGDLWTGFHTEVEKLCLLGMASRQLRMLLPREEWHYLPGGMPYFVVEE